jgi:Zn finger protein HypA/HybF involved in hydrogenase expression
MIGQKELEQTQLMINALKTKFELMNIPYHSYESCASCPFRIANKMFAINKTDEMCPKCTWLRFKLHDGRYE